MTELLTEAELQKIACEEDNEHSFEGEMSCIYCGISFNEAYCDDYDEGDR